MTWWYLSFADEDGWKGVAMVQAYSKREAVKEAWRRGINPGGQVLLAPFIGEAPPEAARNRLITDRAELEQYIGPTRSTLDDSSASS